VPNDLNEAERLNGLNDLNRFWCWAAHRSISKILRSFFQRLQEGQACSLGEQPLPIDFRAKLPPEP